MAERPASAKHDGPLTTMAAVPMTVEFCIPSLDLRLQMSLSLDLDLACKSIPGKVALDQQLLDRLVSAVVQELKTEGVSSTVLQPGRAEPKERLEDPAALVKSAAQVDELDGTFAMDELRSKLREADIAQAKAKQRLSEMRAVCLQE
ncbi:unnamed protein product, partial [Polarella glacialis]